MGIWQDELPVNIPPITGEAIIAAIRTSH